MRIKIKPILFPCFVFTLSLLVIHSSTVQAKPKIFNSNNEDIILKKLEEKGVLATQDVEEIKEKQKQESKIHSINLSARIQTLLTFNNSENGGGNRALDFDVRRLRFQIDGFLYENFEYKFEFDADRVRTVGIKDAWARSNHTPYARLRLGQFKTPFSRQRLISSSKLQLIERSIIQTLYPGRDLGLELSGNDIFGHLDYAVALLSGAGDETQYRSTDNANIVIDGRIAVHPFNKPTLTESAIDNSNEFQLELASSFLYAPNQVAFGENSTDDIFGTFSAYGVTDLASAPLGDTLIFGGDITAFYRGFSLTAEGYYAKFTPNSGGTGKITTARRNMNSYGYFVQGGAFVIPQHLEIAARFEQLNIDTNQNTDVNDATALTGGINYFINKKHDFKVQANYTRQMRKGAFGDNHLVMLNGQFKY